jgi:hypothetical protein
MAYARFSEDSDVYVYLDVGGFLACCGCSQGPSFSATTTEDMIDHLKEHIMAGDVVPDYLIPALEEDRNENDVWIVNYWKERV